MFWVVALSAGALPSSDIRVNQTLDGLFTYSWMSGNDGVPFGFWFACGQIGGCGDNNPPWYQCRCENKTFPVCTQCFRWWDAVILESIISISEYRNDSSYEYLPELIFSRSPYNSTWPPHCSYVDDFAWYTLLYLRVHEWLGDKQTKWLEIAAGLFEWTWDAGYDKTCGGIYWNMCSEEKNSITVLQLLEAAGHFASIYRKQKNTEKMNYYLTRAEWLWDWFMGFDSGRGLLDGNNLISSGAVPLDSTDKMCCNATSASLTEKKCINERGLGFSYNQGMFLAACSYMYQATDDIEFVKLGENVLLAVAENMTINGVLVEQTTPSKTWAGTCSYNQDPGGDWYSFKGVFMTRLGDFLIGTKNVISDAALSAAKLLVSRTSDSAWTHASSFPPFAKNDVCNSQMGVVVNATAPKFLWEWHIDSKPSSTLSYYRSMSTGCELDLLTSRWVSNVENETMCQMKCSQLSSCDKYYYCPSNSCEHMNCWLAAESNFTTANTTCKQISQHLVVGTKKLKTSPISCVGRCGEDTGALCRCDVGCGDRDDCCLDFISVCSADFVCFDARSQGSALSLFVTHFLVEHLL
eukprot:c8222_g1_i2.p1 GENE.c8222_g1_i2~~c8222_g1_i2.p1  ORF type:complete len:579 (+),score=91.41 c8222_g1_i2:35-1771(+)